MSNRLLRRVVGAAVPLTFGCAVLFAIKSDSQNATVFTTLADVPVVEMPQVAAQLVANAPSSQRSAVLNEVLHAVNTLAKPDVAPYAVSAICRLTPSVAPEAAQIAVSLRPAEMLPITKAAVAAAPSSVEQIVSAVCRQAPQEFVSVAQVAEQSAPTAQAQILKGVSVAMPSMEVYVEQAKTYSANTSLGNVLRQADQLAFNAAQGQQTAAASDTLQNQVRSMPVPVILPPYTPPPQIFAQLRPINTQIVIPGTGRDYSAP